MSLPESFRRCFRRSDYAPDVESEVREEFEFYLEQRARDLEREGLSAEQARREALRRFGDLEIIYTRCCRNRRLELERSRRRWTLHSLRGDLMYAVRTFRRTPLFTGIIVVTLVLGIGANTAIFTILNAVLLRPLPYDNPDRLVWVWEDPTGDSRNNVASANFLDWREQNRVFDHLCAFAGSSFIVTGTQRPEEYSGGRVSADFFEMLGIEPIAGRTFLPEEELPRNDRVVVLSHTLWTSRYGADPNLLERAITLNGVPHTVIGILPADFRFRANRYQLWTPLAFEPAQVSRRFHFMQVIGAMKENLTLEQVRADMDRIATALEPLNPPEKEGWGIRIEPLRDWPVQPGLHSSLIILLIVVSLLLLIACVNVSNLLLARSVNRRGELAIRASLGAGRGRLIQQLVTEHLLLVTVSGVIAIIGAGWFIRIFPATFPAVNLPVTAELRLDAGVLGFTLLLVGVTTLLSGLIPAWRSVRLDISTVLKSGGRTGSGTRRQRRILNAQVTAEIALALVLLIGSVLLIRTLSQLNRIETGFRSENLLTMRINLPTPEYADSDRIRSFYRQVLPRLESLPGVESAAITRTLPLQGSTLALPVELIGESFGDRERPDYAPNIQVISPDYFRTVGIELRRGRSFRTSDDENTTPVAIVNERFVELFMPDGDVLGRGISFATLEPGVSDLGPPIIRQIVGVIGDVKVYNLTDNADAEVYLPYSQMPVTYNALAIHTSGDPHLLTREVQEIIVDVDADQPVTGIATMEELLVGATAQPAFRSLLISIFAALALLLALIGIYGVLSYAVSRRAREFGVRMALGAGRADILRSLGREVLPMIVSGMGIGVVIALGLTRFLRSLLFGISPTDPVTFTGVSALIILAAMLACLLPSYRALRTNPATTLRDD